MFSAATTAVSYSKRKQLNQHRTSHSSDTVFLKAKDGDFDGVVTMYHDQGQIAMKMLGFDGGVTVHAGMPVPIGTPAHGTAYDIVGKGVASARSTFNAFDIVTKMAHSNGAAA